MLKKELIEKLEIAQRAYRDIFTIDSDNRELLSKFLDSYKTSRYGFNNDEVDVLEWGEIFFRLGKVFDSSENNTSVLELFERVERIELAQRSQMEVGDTDESRG